MMSIWWARFTTSSELAADEQADHGGAEGDQQPAEHDARDDRHPGGLDDSAADAVGATTAVVLRGVHRDGQTERGQQRHRQTVDARGGGVRGDGVGAERVQRDLHRERADRDDRRLEAHRESESQVLRDVGAGDAPVRAAQVQHRETAAHELEAQQDRDRLGDDRGESRTGDPHSNGPTMSTTSPTFRAHDTVRKTSGVRESPIARMIAER